MRVRRFIAGRGHGRHVGRHRPGSRSRGPGTALSAPAAGASTPEEANLLTLTNQLRASLGAPALTLDARLSSVARSWAQTMAAQGGISHNP